MLRFLDPKKLTLPTASEALAGHDQPMPVPDRHFVNSARLEPPFPDQTERAIFGMGCFWGVERILWKIAGVYTTAVGYAGGFTRHPTYQEVCSGQTGHTEAVLVVFMPFQVTYERLLQAFWENHDPTQGMRQGNDTGTQYRSAIYYTSPAQRRVAEVSCGAFQRKLTEMEYGEITTEIEPVSEFYYAEAYHQQYLAKNPDGYCGLGGTGVSYPVGALVRG